MKARVASDVEETPEARAVMAAFFEGTRLAFSKWGRSGTPWKEYDDFRDAAWESSDSRRQIIDPAESVGHAIQRSTGAHWAKVAESAEAQPARDAAALSSVAKNMVALVQDRADKRKNLAPFERALIDLAATLCDVEAERDEAREELQQTCDLFGRCLARTHKAWHEKNPGNDLVVPDAMESLLAFFDDVERNLELALELGRAESAAERDSLRAQLEAVTRQRDEALRK